MGAGFNLEKTVTVTIKKAVKPWGCYVLIMTGSTISDKIFLLLHLVLVYVNIYYALSWTGSKFLYSTIDIST